jgi:hypothetical protein
MIDISVSNSRGIDVSKNQKERSLFSGLKISGKIKKKID